MHRLGIGGTRRPRTDEAACSGTKKGPQHASQWPLSALNFSLMLLGQSVGIQAGIAQGCEIVKSLENGREQTSRLDVASSARSTPKSVSLHDGPQGSPAAEVFSLKW